MRKAWIGLSGVLIAGWAGGSVAAPRHAVPVFADPGDLIAAEGRFAQVSAAKGLKAALHATAAPDAEVAGARLLRAAAVGDAGDAPSLAGRRQTRQLWMSCDGSIGVSYGLWQAASASGWYATVWQRQKGGAYTWLLETSGAPSPAANATDMIAASVADCPSSRAGANASPPVRAATADHLSGQADDGTLSWRTTDTGGGHGFAVSVSQEGTMRTVLNIPASPTG